jgi:hypothetical protein
LVLFSTFVWQSYIAFSKYFTGGTTFTHQILDVNATDFPAISVCPFDKVYDKELLEEANGRNWSFAKDVEEAKPNFNIYYIHVEGNHGL